MGVSGSGKTTVGTLLAQRLGWPFADADAFHPPENVAKMRAGIPLTDEDRWPWLDAMAAWIDQARTGGKCGVVACSALKRRYRDRIIGARDDVRLVYLEGSYEVIARRMAERPHHYMPVSLLRSQFEALEPPAPEEGPLVMPVAAPPGEIIERIVATLQR
ncbi:gluconate kinase [Betaproteobacteria bacterium GR16-43]|nr:gluconate kinase [Betaproteobacteria bacterium GR16-43]